MSEVKDRGTLDVLGDDFWPAEGRGGPAACAGGARGKGPGHPRSPAAPGCRGRGGGGACRGWSPVAEVEGQEEGPPGRPESPGWLWHGGGEEEGEEESRRAEPQSAPSPPPPPVLLYHSDSHVVASSLVVKRAVADSVPSPPTPPLPARSPLSL